MIKNAQEKTIMPRSLRQSKILELISTYEICTQDELVSKLRQSKFDITQATISRDIKELGLIKIVSGESGKSKYAVAESANQNSNKYLYILKESVISIKNVKNFVVVKVLKGMAKSLCSIIDSLNIDNNLGCTYGEDTILIIFENNEQAIYCVNRLDRIIYD